MPGVTWISLRNWKVKLTFRIIIISFRLRDCKIKGGLGTAIWDEIGQSCWCWGKEWSALTVGKSG